MTYTNTDTLNQAIKSFRRLSIDEQIAALVALYSEAAKSVSPANSPTPSKDVQELIRHVKEMRAENQVQFLQDILAEKKNEQEEVALDPHPSKAMLELIPGSVEPPISQYNSLGKNDRLAFWYQFAQHMGKDGVVALPAQTQPSSKVEEFLAPLKSLDLNQQVEFLGRVL